MPDFDDMFKLATPKYVYIRDAKLGILKFTFMAIIFFYVVIYKIIYTCGHLTVNHADGYGTISMEHPVESCKDDRTCVNKYKSISELKYCKQGPKLERLLSKSKDKKVAEPEEDVKSGDAESKSKDKKVSEPKEDKKVSDAEEDGKDDGPKIGDFITKQQTCRYIDDDRLTLEETPNQVFIPMRYISYEQEMEPECYDPLMKGFRGHVPKKADMDCSKGWVTKSSQEFFVADIGDFTLNLEHSFMASDIGLAGVSTDYKGFMAACPTNHPADIKTDCKRVEVPHSAGDVAPEDLEGLDKPQKLGISSLTGTPGGLDQITFGDLLKLTPVAQDYSWADDVPDRKLPKAFGHPETSIRESGGMLMLGINYDNTGYMRPGIPGLDMPSMSLGAIKPITYTYRPYFVPTKSNKRVEVIQGGGDDATKRTLNIWYGVTVKMSFEGKIVVFSMSQLLHGFTTGLVLLSSATTIVIYLALYIFKHSEKYGLQMYQFTEDMTNYNGLAAKRDVSSFTGDMLMKAENAKTPLTLEQITGILVDSEIRLNRLDGRDPKMAFPATLSPAEVAKLEPPVATFKTAQDTRTNAFFRGAGVGIGAE